MPSFNLQRNKRVKMFKDKKIKKEPLSLQESLNKDELFCVVCMDYPVTKEIYQCKNSHLLCNTCHWRIIEKDTCICPVCRIKLSRDNPCRSRLAEAIISKLVVNCPNTKCGEKLHNENLKKHEKEYCAYRQAKCKFHLLGCDWHGIAKAKRKHEKNCVIRTLDANAILKKTVEKSRERELFERKRTAIGEQDRKLVSMLSQRHRNVLVRDVETYKQNAKFKGVEMGSFRIYAFGVILILEILKNNVENRDSDDFQRTSLREIERTRGSITTPFVQMPPTMCEGQIASQISNPNEVNGSNKRAKITNSAAGFRNSFEINEENATQTPPKTDLPCNSIQARICCVRNNKKKVRIEGFLLSGPQLFCRFRPTYFKFTVKENVNHSDLFTLPLTKTQSEELLSNESANFRLILFDKGNGLDPRFAVNQNFFFGDSEHYSDEYDDVYEEYSDDFERDLPEEGYETLEYL